VFIHILLAAQAMAPHSQSLITGENNDCFITLAGLFQCLQDPADLLIHV